MRRAAWRQAPSSDAEGTPYRHLAVRVIDQAFRDLASPAGTAAGRESALASQVHALRGETETLRLRAEEAQREVEALQKRVAAVTAEKAVLAERVVALEKGAQERPTVARAEAGRERAGATAKTRPRATPVVSKKPR